MKHAFKFQKKSVVNFLSSADTKAECIVILILLKEIDYSPLFLFHVGYLSDSCGTFMKKTNEKPWGVSYFSSPPLLAMSKVIPLHRGHSPAIVSYFLVSESMVCTLYLRTGRNQMLCSHKPYFIPQE